MALNNVDSNAPEDMVKWVREVEAKLQALQQTVDALSTQVGKGS